MENCLVFVVAKFEVLLGAVEVLFEHWNIIVLQSVVEGQIAIVIADVRSWADLINNGMLLVHAYYVLNRLSLEVLLTSCLKELIAAREPVKDVLVSVASALKQGVFTKVVLLLKCFILMLFKDLEHLHVLSLNCSRERVLSLKVGLQTLLRTHFKNSFNKVVLTCPACNVKWCVSLESISAVEDVQIGEHVLCEQEVYNVGFLQLNS